MSPCTAAVQKKKKSQILHARQFFPSLFAVHLYHYTTWILVKVLNIPVKTMNEIYIVSLTSLSVSNFFICLSLHGGTLLTSEVVIYFILGSLCYLFHTNYLSLCVLFYREYEKWKKKNLICRELMHMSRTILKSYMHGHFCFSQITGNFVISSNCRAQVSKSYMHVTATGLEPTTT